MTESAPPISNRPAFALMLLAVFTSSWNGLHIGSLQLVDILLAASFGCLALTALTWGRLWVCPIPRWLWAAPAAILLDITIRLMSPIPSHYLAARVDLIGLDWGESPSQAMAGAQWLVAVLFLPLTIAGSTQGDIRKIRTIARFWVLGVVVSALVAMTDKLGLTTVSAALISDGVDYSGRQAGLTAHANSLGVSCVLALPFAFTAFRNRAVGLPLQLLLASGVLLSGSRGSQLLAVLLALALVAASREVRPTIALFTGAATVVSPLLIALMGGPAKVFGTLLRFGGSATSASDSDAERTQVGVQALQDIQAFPVAGIGLNNITYAHNILLQILSAGGIILLIGLVIYFGGALSVRHLDVHRTMAMAAKLTICAWLVLGLIENSLVDRFLYVPVGLILSMGVAALYNRRRTDQAAIVNP